MAPKVKSRVWRRNPRKVPLQCAQRWELILGPHGPHTDKPPLFPSDAARRAAWVEHRDSLLKGVNPTVRPWAWWEYESPEPRESDEAAQLRRLGLLSANELALLDRWAAAAAARLT
jgi:hypothetical protein